jgi:hypothetical protein
MAMTSGNPPHDVPVDGDMLAYREGYSRALREFAWARDHGFVPTERHIVLALMQATKVYETVRGGKSIAGRQPEWLHGRADALRTLLSQGAGAIPPDTD